MDRRDLLTVAIEGQLMTVCVLGSYAEECRGEEMIIPAVINQENMVHVPEEDLERLCDFDKLSH